MQHILQVVVAKSYMCIDGVGGGGGADKFLPPHTGRKMRKSALSYFSPFST
jgi:hypothetical protein